MPDPLEVQSLARGLNELLILASLESGPMHGYQIALEIEARSGGYFAFKHGTLYPILHQLEKEGFIDGEWGEGTGPRRRKEYRLKREGERRLEERADEWRRLGDRLAAFLGDESAIRGRASAG